MRRLLICALLLLVCEPASAVVKKPLPPRAQSAGSVVPLTEHECTGLGGKVESFALDCASTRVCVVVDNHGVIHRACVDR